MQYYYVFELSRSGQDGHPVLHDIACALGMVFVIHTGNVGGVEGLPPESFGDPEGRPEVNMLLTQCQAAV